ncbi:hypothetical protein KRP22_007570 [Phytophthora ramorum]|nr:hypothetical protein KRP22_4419 [Phytophthora ramorum]
MSLATLRDIEQHLSLAVDAAQRHLEAASALDASVPCSQDAADHIQSLAGEIERLRTQLQSVVASVLTQTRHKRISVTVEAPDAAIQGPHMDDTETETEDDSMGPSLINYAQQEAQPKQEKLFKSQPEPVTNEELAASLQRFENATEEAAAAIETGKSLVKIPIAFGNCRKTSANVLLILKRREFVDDASACLYRDTLTKLAHIASDERAFGRIQAKALTQVMDQVETLLRLADEIDGTPSALSGAEVRSAQLKLGKYAEDNAESRLTKMHKYVESIPKRGLSGDRVEGPMKKLICDLHQEMNMYQAYQKFGLPPRSEERWAIFTEITETLGDWIGRTAMTAQPPKVLKPMFRAAQKFQKEFPGRVPSIFLKNAGMRLRSSRQQQRAGQKAKGKKRK